MTSQHLNTITNAIEHFAIATRTATKVKLWHPGCDCIQANRWHDQEGSLYGPVQCPSKCPKYVIGSLLTLIHYEKNNSVANIYSGIHIGHLSENRVKFIYRQCLIYIHITIEYPGKTVKDIVDILLLSNNIYKQHWKSN